jgi:hypothetical protein
MKLTMIIRVIACKASRIRVREVLYTLIRDEVDAHVVINPIRFGEFVSVSTVAVGMPHR